MPSIRIPGTIAALLVATQLSAQTPSDLIRGRVTDDSSKSVSAATVIITRGPDRAIKQTTTDSTGHYSLTFENGTGDYLVAISAVGLKPARRRVQRVSTERELVADFVLSHDLSVLASVKVTAEKPAKATNTPNPFGAEPGASEKWADGVDGRLSPTLAGSLTALAGTMPGMTLGAGGLSMLGAGSESNLTTLNGMAMGGTSIPRAAQTETRVTGATFDPTRGGFAGANIDVRLAGGSRSYQQRNAYVTFDEPAWQFTDAIGRSLGATNQSFRGSVGADGELIRRVLTYNVALDFARSTSNPATLFHSDPISLTSAGVSADSVARAIAAASALGLSLAGRGIPDVRQHDALTWLGRFDDTRDTLSTRTLTTYAGYTKDGATNFSALAAPSTGGERSERTLGAQLQIGNYFGAGQHVLNQTRFAASQVHTESTPYVELPGAGVLVRTTSAGGGIASLGLGGSSFLDSRDTRWTAEGANETIWNAHGRRHTFKTLGWFRADGVSASGSADVLGRFAFNSIADFAANRPSSYSRTLVQPEREGTVWNAAAAVAHQYAPTRFFSMLYGARVEASGFGLSPTRNPALESALGIATGVAPTRLHVSPRFGFSYTYNRDKDNGNGSSSNSVGRFYRNTSGVIKGGIGEFRDLLRPDLLADASSHTGLAGSAQSLSCVGAAVPVPDWSRFLADPGSVPSRCADGSGALADLAPPATLISKGYDTPRSWRASLDWNSNVGPWMLRVSTLGTYDLSQPGTIDANFGGASKFTLSGEGNRPVFVSTAAIDAASGSVSAAESRRSASYGRVGVRSSDLTGYGGQATFTIAPDMFRRNRHIPLSPYVSLAYTLQGMRREYRGFDGAAFGDPREKEWAPNANDARQVVVLQGGLYHQYIGSWTFFARRQSGLPFTPIVQGDVNGDGRSGDRAFVPSVSGTTDPAVAAQLKSLLADGSAEARKCLQDFAGQVASRNGCRGPWTSTLSMQWRPPLPQSIARRLTGNVYFENVLGGVDQLLHGENNLRGWGTSASPDPVLLVPRGFDAATKSFRYDINPRFADTRASRTTNRTPFRITVDFRLLLSTDYDLQQLRRALEPVKVQKGWERRSADSLTAFYLSNTSDIYKALLAESDSLFLSTRQIASLRAADSVFSAEVRAVYLPLGRYLSQFSDGVATKAALDSVAASSKAYWKSFWRQPEVADSSLTSTQRELMPMLKGMLGTPMKEREHSQWQFGWPVKITDQQPSKGTGKGN